MVDNLQAAMHSVDHMAQGIVAQTTCNVCGSCGHKLATSISQVKLCHKYSGNPVCESNSADCKKPPLQKDPKVDVPREGGVEINQIYENSGAC
ncbi:hypothetical protein GOP47_0002740 [Adiantum capillus-veneris]|uniref:Uncharacterized protein n=1 Tax=Adiantum capillus-veneris TaxID=13818 RepID=A0A9D4VB77_ADICA|nr:hypothetical protein GOP47_0002740 [Adiantum capillus-veneris]